MRGDARGAIVTAPFSARQVLALNLCQIESPLHPFTCETDHVGGRDLVATLHGWVCPKCSYTQDWAHACMTAWTQRRTRRVPVATAWVGRRG